MFGVTLFLWEVYTLFSGQPFYNDWAMASYNVLFTSLPVIAMGVFNQDVSARFCLNGIVPTSTPELCHLFWWITTSTIQLILADDLL